ncbi:hypothetical protein BJ170DRAFT_641783 [Xylariales sp. AK1849]|nr:hypothetical protein BJ170DRAFT_641783 [Xylariales sp. AK1849]
MNYPWDVVIIVCCCVLGVLMILGIWFRVKLHMHYESIFKEQNKCKPAFSRSLQRAVTELKGVTENRGHRSEQRQSNEYECPICLASLYSNPVGTAPTTGSELDLEAGVSRTTTITTTSTASTALKEQKNTVPWQPQPIDDEVLKMKRCQHMFHARCLATWFLRRRYDCPVCRTLYYQVVEVDTSRDHREDLYVREPTIPVVFW